MAKFVFQLEGVLKYRHNLERQRQLEVAQILQEKTVLEEELKRLTNEVQTSNREALPITICAGRLDVAFYRRPSALSGGSGDG